MAAGGAKKSQHCHKYFLQYSTFASDLSFEHGGAKLASSPGRYLTSLRPCTRAQESENYALFTESSDKLQQSFGQLNYSI